MIKTLFKRLTAKKVPKTNLLKDYIEDDGFEFGVISNENPRLVDVPLTDENGEKLIFLDAHLSDRELEDLFKSLGGVGGDQPLLVVEPKP